MAEKNIFVKYVGPKKVMHVPFGREKPYIPAVSMSEVEETIDFPKNQMIELRSEWAEALLKAAPQTFKHEGTIKPKAFTIKSDIPKLPSIASEITEEEFANVSGNTDSALED